MPKTKTKAKSNTKTTTKSINYKTPCIVLGCLLVASLCGLIYCAANMKTAEEQQYLDLTEHLLRNTVKWRYEQADHNQHCDIESYGLSPDNDVAVRFWCLSINTETHQPIEGSEVYHTLYFQHRGEENGKPVYAQALGD